VVEVREVIVWESVIGPWCLRDKSVSLLSCC